MNIPPAIALRDAISQCGLPDDLASKLFAKISQILDAELDRHFKVGRTALLQLEFIQKVLSNPLLFPMEAQFTSPHMRVVRETVRKIITDEKSELLTSSTFKWRLHHFLRHERREQLCAIGAIDMRRFRNINSAVGHHTADDVIREIGKLLMTHLRGSDGDETYGDETFYGLWTRRGNIG